MYEKFNQEAEAFKEILYNVAKMPQLEFKHLPKFYTEGFAAKANLKKMLNLGDDYRREFRISGTNVISESNFFQIFRRYIDGLYNDARASRNNLSEKHRLLLSPLCHGHTDPKGRGLAEMISENLIQVSSREQKFSRYLHQFCNNETFGAHLVKDPLTASLGGKFQTFDAFTSAMFEHAGNAKRAVIISANPLDIMLSSDKFGSNRSCHSLDGEYVNGNICYALSDITAIVLLRAEQPTEYPYLKVGRMWLYLDKQSDYNKILLGRSYGNIQPSQVNEIMTEITGAVGPQTTWWVGLGSKVPVSRVAGPRGYGRDNVKPLYFDEQSSAFAATSLVATKDEVSSNQHDVLPLLSFPGAVCLECGCKTYDHRWLACEKCTSKKPKCGQCHSYVRPGVKGVHEHKGHHYCAKCFGGMFFRCFGCQGSFVIDNDARSLPISSRNGERNQSAHCCLACYEKKFNCPCCQTYFMPEEAHKVGGARKSVCGQCLDEKYKICSTCESAEVRVLPELRDGVIVAIHCVPCFTKLKAKVSAEAEKEVTCRVLT